MKKSQHTAKYRKLLLELKVARVRARLTQTEASEKLRAYRTYLTKIESGERKIDVLELAELCHLYGLKLTEFLRQVGLD